MDWYHDYSSELWKDDGYDCQFETEPRLSFRLAFIISPEVRANLADVARTISNTMKKFNELDFSGLNETISRFAEMSKLIQPANDNAKILVQLISDGLKNSIESANKSADSEEKSANKSADASDNSDNDTENLSINAIIIIE